MFPRSFDGLKVQSIVGVSFYMKVFWFFSLSDIYFVRPLNKTSHQKIETFDENLGYAVILMLYLVLQWKILQKFLLAKYLTGSL